MSDITAPELPDAPSLPRRTPPDSASVFRDLVYDQEPSPYSPDLFRQFADVLGVPVELCATPTQALALTRAALAALRQQISELEAQVSKAQDSESSAWAEAREVGDLLRSLQTHHDRWQEQAERLAKVAHHLHRTVDALLG